jgi:hypothetical protein
LFNYSLSGDSFFRYLENVQIMVFKFLRVLLILDHFLKLIKYGRHCKKAAFLQVGKKPRNWSVLCETVCSDINLFHSAGLTIIIFLK